jgi:hypothetical protein
MRLLLASAAVVLLAACGGGGSYSAEEAQSAFEANGFTLIEPPPDPAGFTPNPWQTGEPLAFVPEGGPAFFVFVGDVADPDELWARYDPDHGPATLDASRGNVFVMSDSPLASAQRERIGNALEALGG